MTTAKMAASMAKQGLTPSPTTSSPQVGGAVTASGNIVGAGGVNLGTANVKDRQGYVPGSSPTDSSALQTPSQVANAVSTSLANPTTTPPTAPNVAQVNAPNTPVPQPQLNPNDQAPQSLVDQLAQATQGVNALKQKHTQMVSDLNKTGVPSPSNPGAAGAAMNAALGTQQQSTPLPPSVENFLNPENPAVSDSTKQLMEWLNPQSDRKMLDEHIAQLSADRAELAGLKTNLMNTKRVMAGTEQDIRDEVTKAGGFATDSQVQAMTIARNKSLLQNAQLISDQIQSQTDLVNSDVSLIGDEKQMASQQFNQRMSLVNYQQENTKNSFNALKDSYKTMIDANPQGLYNSLLSDPAQAQRFQTVTGLSVDTLKGMASSQSLDTQLKQIQIQKGLKELSGDTGGVQTLTGKPQNASQSSANGYADRLNEANLTIDAIGGKFAGTLSQLPMFNFMKTGDRQAFEQAKTNFVTAVLRRESGASISPTEFKNEELKYFPQPGDKPTTVAQKANARNTAINNLYREAGVNRPVLPGQVIESGGKRYQVGSDGQTLTQI